MKNYNLIKQVFVVLMITVSCLAHSAVKTPAVVGLSVSEFDKLFSGITEVKENSWENWGLTKEEWDKYLLIKEKTMWSSWDGNPSPLQLLAIYSSSVEQKRHYAQIEARLDRWRLDAALTYQQIYKNEAAIFGVRYASFINGKIPSVENIKPGENILLFINTEKGVCNTRCAAVVKPLLKSGASINIYAVDITTQEKLFAWATSADIPVDQVQAGQITLNFDEGAFSRVSDVPPAFAIIPAAYVQRETGWLRVIQ